METTPISPIKPPAAYLGGKSRLAKRLVAAIGLIEHERYVEVFFGMGSVFFARPARPKMEVINDKADEVVNFFRIAQRHPDALCVELSLLCQSRSVFDRLKATPPGCMTDIERAVRFYYLQLVAFGGKAAGQSFGVDASRCRFNAEKVLPRVHELHRRLAGVMIEHWDWAEVVRRYDSAGTLFYLDPPYFDGEDDYGVDLFERSQYGRMALQLASIKGAFIMSINDRQRIREEFGRFTIIEAETRYSVGSNDQRVTELVITNRPEIGRVFVSSIK